MNKTIIFTFFYFLIFSINSYAFPSFDCQKAKTNVEKTICQNYELYPNNLQIKSEQEA